MKKYFPAQKNKDEVIIPIKKGNYKNLSEMKPIFKKPRPQSRQPSRLTSSRQDSSLRSRIINDKLPLPPIAQNFDHTKFNQQTKTIIRIIKRIFKTTDAQTIKNIIANQREKKRDLLSKQNETETTLQNILLKKSKCETSIHNFSPIKIRDVLLITEGKAALSFLNSEKEIILQTLQNYQAQKNALMMSCRHLCDLFELPEVNDFEDLKASFQKIQQIIKKSNVISSFKCLQRGKVSFMIPDYIPSSRIGFSTDESINGSNSEASLDESAISVPRLSLASARGYGDFYPGTRSTRRALIAFNSNSDFRETLSARGNNDLQFFGKSLGNIFVDRFYSEISKENRILSKIENNCEGASLSPIFVNKVTSYSCKEILKNLADHYIKYQEYLYLSVLSDYEISKTEKSFMQFTAARDFLIQKLNDKYEEECLVSTFEYIININDVSACYFIRDIILKCEHKLNNISNYFDKFVPLFQKRLFSLSSVTEIAKTTPFIAYFSCFATFLINSENNRSFTKRVLSLIDSNLSKIMNIFVNSMSSSISRCGFISLFQIGKFCPQLFYQCIELQNKGASDFLVYLRQNIMFTTCVKEAAEFFNKSFYLLSRESSLFHTAMIFHYSLLLLFNPSGINVDNISSLLSCLITVVANRNKYTSDQLIGLGFLQFLMKNFELEAFLASNSSKPIQFSDSIKEVMKPIINNKVSNQNNNNKNETNNTIIKLNRINNNKTNSKSDTNDKNDYNINNNNDEKDLTDKKNVNDDDENDGKMKVSYLNIPKMKLPHLNLENPKLQLHFKPYSSINKNSVRSSISSFQYLEQRKRHPIYLSKELHIVNVQLMFALLIDHNTHRLDTFFCDPFPSANRKPNVLYILMQHMEGKLNQEIISPLKQIFNPSSNQNEIKDNKNGKNKDFDNDEKIKTYFNDSGAINFNNTNPIQPCHSTRYEIQQYQDNMRLLRLTVPSCFNSKNYSNGYHIASGAFGAVMGVTYDGNDLAVKILEKSRNECDNPHLIEVYTEVTILEICKGDRRVTQLYDYGCSSDSYYIVMENYPMTLKAWRKSFRINPTNDNEEKQKEDEINTQTINFEIDEDDDEEESENKTNLIENNKHQNEEQINKDENLNNEFCESINDAFTEEEESENKTNLIENNEEEQIANKNADIKNENINNEDINKSDHNEFCENIDDAFTEEEENFGIEEVKKERNNEFSTTGSSSCEWSKENAPSIDTLLRVYREFLNCATVLTDHHINHFDIKCDNVMLDTSGKPALGDFGESMLYNNEKNCYTLLNRGTEWIKSPEMLSIALDSSANSPNFDRLKKVGAGPASDVWSIGCLFFELITGEYLFIDSDWSRFFMRVTNPNEKILPEEKVKMLPDDPRFKTFIEFVLQRSVRRRPNLRQVIVKFDEMFPDASKAPLPEIKKRKPPPFSPPSSFSPSSESLSPFPRNDAY